MDCRCVQEKLSLYLDGVLDEATLEAVETHTASCTECRMELEAMRVLVEVTGHVDEVEPPAYLRSSIMHLVQRVGDEANCSKIVALLSEYIDDELPEPKAAMVYQHLESCQECAREHAVLANLVRTIADVNEVESPVYLRERIMASVAVQQTSVLARVAAWIGSGRVKRLSWVAAGAAAMAVFAGVMITDRPDRQVERVAVQPVPQVVKRIETSKPESARREVAATPEKAVVKSIVRSKSSDRMAYTPQTSQSHVTDRRLLSDGVSRMSAKTPTQKHVKRSEPVVALTHQSGIPEVPETQEAVNKEAVVPEVKTVENNEVMEPVTVEPVKEEQAPSLMKIAVAPQNPSRDMHAWVESVKQEFAVKHQVKNSSTIQLFDKKF